jgi:hypothetical protein
MGCDSTGHAEHVCSLKARGAFEEIEKLAVNPTHQCGNCGAKVNCPDNVCKPEPL